MLNSGKTFVFYDRDAMTQVDYLTVLFGLLKKSMLNAIYIFR